MAYSISVAMMRNRIIAAVPLSVFQRISRRFGGVWVDRCFTFEGYVSCVCVVLWNIEILVNNRHLKVMFQKKVPMCSLFCSVCFLSFSFSSYQQEGSDYKHNGEYYWQVVPYGS